MKLKTFKRGVHPKGNKHYTCDLPIEEFLIKGDACYPMSQHIGAPCIPVVEVGEQVKKGQLIAKAGGFVSANIFSAVSGKVKAIEPRHTMMGETCDTIVIENDGLFEEVDNFGEKVDYSNFSKEQIIERIQFAGIVGLGGAGFPTHVKLSPKEPENIDYVIINAAECEPFLTSDYRLMLEKTDELLKGCEILLRLFDNAKCVIGIEDNKKDAWKLLNDKNDNDRISAVLLKTKYPQGGERTLIKAITNRELNSKKLPADVGCVVVNAASTIAIYEAVAYNMPLIKRVMTITGNAAAKPCNALVSIGMNHKELLEAVGGFNCEPQKVVSGGPMMGTALFDMDFPVTKTSSSILSFEKDEVALCDTSACIHCGRCIGVCPERLVPQMLMAASDNELFDEFEKLHGMECIECGSCTYVCPAKRPLTQSFKFAKRKVIANRKKNS
ncbi:MAG: electron transport complex subunit RsxC [Clostridia bacterium]|nr:electron transport complex subunit RsxC [Clostridia bacterium]